MTSVETPLFRSLSDAGVRYAMASYVDIHGKSKCKIVPLSHLDQMMKGSELFTGAALDGVPQEVSDDEVAAIPDPDSCIQLPWRPELAWFASDLHLRGKPFEACSRGILKRQLRKAADLGYQFNLGIETEFFLMRDAPGAELLAGSPKDSLNKPCYDGREMLNLWPVVEEIVAAMNKLGWDVYSFDHEDAPGQFETDFAYCDALKMAERFTFFRLMVNEIAGKHGLFASFMPKPFSNRTGSGAHYNMSLADARTGRNLFETERDPRGCGLSKLGYQFIAGILRHASAICAVIAPTVNSYKRLIAQGSMSGSTWAPVFISYGNNNRTNMMRIPLGGGRVECRAADISCNPYLGAAIMLAAGMEGIEEGLDPGEPRRENLYKYSRDELKQHGIRRLPRNLAEAVEAFAEDPLSRQVFGAAMFDAFVDFKTREWEEYHNHVSEWEIARYARFF
jgi:glutamine synthetase